MKRLLVLILVFLTIIVNGVVFDVLQPSHGHGDKPGDNENSHKESVQESYGESH